jgi:purine-binding chemotaxis protein CheW
MKKKNKKKTKTKIKQVKRKETKKSMPGKNILKKETRVEPSAIDIVGFHIGKDYFGVDIRMVNEVLRMVEITKVPKSPSFVEGVINIRGRIVPIINLRMLFHLQEKSHTLNTEMIIARIDDKEIGLTIDQIAEIVTTQTEDILPPDKQTVPIARFLVGMITLKQGLMLLIDLKKILDTEKRALLRKITAAPQAGKELEGPVTSEKKALRVRALELSKRKEDKTIAARQVITFNLGHERYGVDITKVREISELSELYYIPSAPQYVLGALNLRGDIIAIMDLKRLFGLRQDKKTEQSQIIILDHAVMNIGFTVESVCNIVSLAEKEIEPPLATIERTRMDFIEGEARHKGELIGLLNVKNIIDALDMKNETQ